jgi:excisionase family DNA binding protein
MRRFAMTDLMGATEVAERLGITYQDAHRAIARGELPSARVGRARRVPRQEFEEWVRELSAETVARQTFAMLEGLSHEAA